MPDVTFDDLISQSGVPANKGAVSFDDLVPGAPPQEKSTLAGDIAKSIGSGIVRGAAETVMLPVTAKRLLDTYATPYEVGAVNAVRGAFGYDPLPVPTAEEIESGGVDRALNAGQDAVRGAMDEHLHAPETTPGKYAETIAEFAVPGGGPSRATRAAQGIGRRVLSYAGDVTRNAVVPGAASEAAGQLTEGTSAEPYARLLGAIAGNVGGAVVSARTPESVLARAVGDPEQIDWARALALQDNSTGVRLTGPEAITHAQNGGTSLADLQRLTEGSVSGGARMRPFLAERPAQVDTAVNRLLDAIAPQSANPSTLGPRASEAATNAIDDARQAINAQTRPLYQASAPAVIPDAEFQAMRADPRFRLALERLRNNPEIAPGYANLPDNSVGVVDAVTKDMYARGEALANSANPGYAPEIGALNTQAAANARDVARNVSSEYDQALAEQARLRREQLQPVAEGPLGRVAAASTTSSASDALLPRNPLVGSEGETADAMTRLMAQDPETAQALARQSIADRYARAATETQSGDREFAGAKFAKDIAGNQPRNAVLDAILRSLPDQTAATAAPELLDVLRATGRRKPIGSATEFNRAANAELSQAPLAQRAANAAGTFGASLIANAGDALSRATLRGNINRLADMFTDPNSVDLIREAIARGETGLVPRAVARGTVQSAVSENR